MFGKILGLSFKSYRRSPAFTQNLATTIFMVLMTLYFGGIFILLAGVAPWALEKLEPVNPPALEFGKYFMYTIFYLFVARLIFQNFGFTSLKQYILQKVKKSTILHYILTKTAFSWTNIMPLLAIIAYLITSTYKEGYEINTLTHGIVLISILYASNYIAFALDKLLSVSVMGNLGALAVLALLNFLDFKGLLPLGDAFISMYSFLVENIGTALISTAVAIASYFLAYNSLQKVAYLEDKGEDSSVSDFGLKAGTFSMFGKAGELMELETKLIWRNKRSKNMLYVIPLIFFYPLIFNQDTYSGIGWKIFVAIFTTGGFALTYGQLLLSWNSGHFDLLLTKMKSIKEIFKAKYYLQCIIVVVQSAIMILYGFLSPEYFYLMPSMMFYNLGVVLFMYMVLASYNSKKIDTNKGAAMNYEGFSLSIFLIVIPIMIIPVASYYGFKAMGMPIVGGIFPGVLGLLGFIFHDKLMDFAVNLFKKNRHKIGSAFRAN